MNLRLHDGQQVLPLLLQVQQGVLVGQKGGQERLSTWGGMVHLAPSQIQALLFRQLGK